MRTDWDVVRREDEDKQITAERKESIVERFAEHPVPLPVATLCLLSMPQCFAIPGHPGLWTYQRFIADSDLEGMARATRIGQVVARANGQACAFARNEEAERRILSIIGVSYQEKES